MTTVSWERRANPLPVTSLPVLPLAARFLSVAECEARMLRFPFCGAQVLGSPGVAQGRGLKGCYTARPRKRKRNSLSAQLLGSLCTVLQSPELIQGQHGTASFLFIPLRQKPTDNIRNPTECSGLTNTDSWLSSVHFLSLIPSVQESFGGARAP